MATARELLDEAIAWGSGQKSVRNSYHGWMASDSWHTEQRDAAIATTDAMIAQGFLVAANAQITKEMADMNGDPLDG